MRLIGTIKDEGKVTPLAFSYYLTSKGIENSAEEVRSSLGHASSYEIWIVDEDQVEEARLLLEEYLQEPTNSRYKSIPPPKRPSQPKATPAPRRSLFSLNAMGPLTIITLTTVIILFFWAQFERGNILPPPIKGVVQAPFLAPIERGLIYDYPTYFALRDELFSIWTAKDIKEKKPPPPEAYALLQKMQETPVWMGIYNRIMLHKQDPAIPLRYEGPLFQKISQGQYWRLLTPAYLHYDLLHIFFNVLWFLILGSQIEQRIKFSRSLILFVAAAVVSNTAQYLMSGPFFMGLSGVICAQAAFIWARQQKAPWEGYLLHRLTLIFLAAFVGGMALLSIGIFFLQYFADKEFSLMIANTAHLSGALVGYLLGRMRFFASHI